MPEEYFCSNCENVFTSTVDADSSPCPECGFEAIKIGGARDKAASDGRYSRDDLDMDGDEAKTGTANPFDDEVSNFDDLELDVLNFSELDGDGLPQSI